MLQFPLRLLAWHQQIASIMMVAQRLEIQGIMLYQNIRNITNTAGMHRSTCEYVIAYCTKVSLRSPLLSSTTKPTCFNLGLHSILYWLQFFQISISMLQPISFHCAFLWNHKVLHMPFQMPLLCKALISHDVSPQFEVIQGLVSRTWVRWVIACSNGVRDTQKYPTGPLSLFRILHIHS